jgi:biopolymer transport protein ExbD
MRTPQLLSSGTATINMTPMIDVVFLLIIFFLVSSHLAKQENHVELKLPLAGSGLGEVDDRESVVVNILADGQWQSGGATVNEAELNALLRRRLMAAAGPIQLRIRTDQDVVYERIEPVLTIASKAGIGDIAFSVYEARKK